jgi:DNA-binding GntR family transcriptional regulator
MHLADESRFPGASEGEGAAAVDRPAPRYAAIERRLETAIRSRALPAGAVLTEGPIAALFGTSRTPVRTALGVLADRGLLERFSGRGFVVPGADAPQRLRLTPGMLGLSAEIEPEPKPVAAERIERAVEDAIAAALPFGRFRISEQAAADGFGVSRTVIRELLSRLQDRGLVAKDARSHWVVGPLTARDVAHYFAIRARLEPLALAESAPRLPAAEIAAALDRTERALAAAGPDLLAECEADIHIRLLARAPNPHLLRMIRQSQIALVVNRVFANHVGARPFASALREHAIVLEFLTRGAWSAAAEALAAHLALSAERTRQRLMAISVFPEPEPPAWLRGRQG